MGQNTLFDQVLQFSCSRNCLPSQGRTPCIERVCHGCHDEVHYRLVCQRLRSQGLRSRRARTEYSRPRDPFSGRPGLSVPFPRVAESVFLAGRGERSSAVASETARRTTVAGAPEYVGHIAPGAVSSQFQAGGRRARVASLWTPTSRRPAIPRLRSAPNHQCLPLRDTGLPLTGLGLSPAKSPLEVCFFAFLGRAWKPSPPAPLPRGEGRQQPAPPPKGEGSFRHSVSTLRE